MAIKNLGKVVPEKGVDYFTDEDIRSLNIPKRTSDLTNDSGYITGYTESDPTVPSHVKSIKENDISNWNNKANASDIPTKISELTNDSLYATESYVKNQIANAQLGGEGGEIDLSGYATKDELNNKVDKVNGKSLISDSEITRLASVTNYDDTEIKNTLNSKANASAIPTKTSQLTNDSGYMTNYTESDPTVPAHVKAITQNDINKWNVGGSGLTTEQINALNEMFKVCAYIKEDVGTEYGAFKTAFGIDDESEGTEPTKTLQSISATYTGGNVEVGTNVNTLTGITVKANYSDGTSTNVTGYTLSGTIAEGSNTITVTYQGLTTTFAVTGVAEEIGGGETTKTLQSISATYTGGNVTVGTSVNSLTGVTVKANYSDGSQENVTGYTLSGTIIEGNNTITVSYEGLTTTFIVVGITNESSGIAEYEYNIENEGKLVNQTGEFTVNGMYNTTNYIEVDRNYNDVSIATYMNTPVEVSTDIYHFTAFYNEDVLIKRDGGHNRLSVGENKVVNSISIPAEATKFIVSVQNNCNSFKIFKGKVSKDEI